jgi:membrane protein implicated in regulation of membrane protease activity
MVLAFLGTGLERILWATAILGGALFLIRLVMLFVGGIDHDGDASGAGDADTGGFDGHDADSTSSFALLSLQSVSAFFMMFGLVGLAILRGLGEGGALWAVLGGFAAGAVSVWVIGKILSVLRGLQSSGTLDMANAVGVEGTVYLRIPADGTGKVQVEIQGRLHEVNAVSEDKVELKTGDAVRVVRVAAGSILSVRRA